MKTHPISLMLSLLFFAFYAEAQGFSSEDWKVGISSRFRWEDSNPPKPMNNKQFSTLRIRSQLTFTGIQGLKVFAEPQYNKILGRQDGAVGSSGNVQYDGSIDAINLRVGYLDFSVGDKTNIIIGRQNLSYGDQYLMGAADWGPYGRTFDTLRARYKQEAFWMDVFQAKLVEANYNAVDQGRDKDLLGLYASVTPSGVLKSADVYGFYMTDGQKDNAATTDPTRPWDFGVYGTRLVSDMGSWNWKIEAAKNFGDENTSAMDSDSDNYMVDAQTNYLFGEGSKQGLGLRVFIAGTQWRDLYPTPHSLFGRTDIIGRRNLMGARLRWSAGWAEDFSTTLDFFAFNRVNKNQSAFQIDSKTPLAVGNSTSADLGYEVDFNVKKTVNPNMSVGAGINALILGPYFEQRSGDLAHFAYFMIETKY